jgi:putative phage-type endonuclease
MDFRFDLDNIINKHLYLKNAWCKLDNNTLPKSFIRQLSDKLKFIYNQDNLFSNHMISERIDKIRSYRKQLAVLKTLPVIEQRSPEWYASRHNLITASDFGDALGIEKFGKKANVNKFYEKKCGFEAEPVFDNSNIFLQWGIMFEPIATNIYKNRTGIAVHEFGLVVNKRFNFLGASPDGISDLGVMLEIKCPYKRVITDDSILKQYYYQIQGQLDSCELMECDFLEVKFDEYTTPDEFWDDFEDEQCIYTKCYKEKGIIIKTQDNAYIYSPYNVNKSSLTSWLNNSLNGNAVKVYFWYLESFSLKRVEKQPQFVDNLNIQLTDVWNNILKYRNNKDIYDQDIKSNKINNDEISNKRKTFPKNTVGALFIQDVEY